MTLLLTAVSPEGIVLGADSALTFRSADDELSLLGFPKIIPVPQLSLGISLAGSAEVNPDGQQRWISTWLRAFAQESEADSFSSFCDQLVGALTELPGPRELNVFHCASWVLADDAEGVRHAAPRMAEVSNETGDFVWRSMLPDEFVQEVLSWRQGDQDKGYPIRFISSGLPPGFSDWIVQVGTPGFSRLVGRSVPNPQVTAVAEYVRFLIRMVAELHRVARMSAYVGEPVETLLLFPNAKNMFSTRY